MSVLVTLADYAGKAMVGEVGASLTALTMVAVTWRDRRKKEKIMQEHARQLEQMAALLEQRKLGRKFVIGFSDADRILNTPAAAPVKAKKTKDTTKPPRAASVLLDLLVQHKDYDQIVGDIEEAYNERRSEHILLYAKALYWWDTVCSIVRLWAPKVVKWIFIIEEIRRRSRPR